MRLLFFFLLSTLAVLAQDEQKLLPVNSWPRVIQYDGKQIVNPSVETCVAAGYRLIPEKQPTPGGLRIVSETLVQDDKKSDSMKWVIVYEEKPAPSPIKHEILTNVSAERVLFRFTTNGAFRGFSWLDAPASNAVSLP